VTRSISPVPATLPLADVTKPGAVRERLAQALRLADTFIDLRTYVVELASDLEAAERDPVDAMADTQRMQGAPWDDECAPSTPRGSPLGEEYGV
jgi:hypothetical protein